ncbi:uncharacterized protein LOC141659955 [Apium graveolens]|uniref:uncharacterized protein LOC141659955 n=1 Tax=Apium graveolens TaxID=4045 RepID=UPI003D7BA607
MTKSLAIKWNFDFFLVIIVEKNLQDFENLGAFGGPGSSSSAVRAPVNKDQKMQSVEQLVLDLSNPNVRENALLELSKFYEDSSEDAYMSPNCLLLSFMNEIVSIYPVLSPPNLTLVQSNRVWNALVLLQVATLIVQKILLDDVGWDNPRACDFLRSCLLDMLRDSTFSSCLRLTIWWGLTSKVFESSLVTDYGLVELKIWQ